MRGRLLRTCALAREYEFARNAAAAYVPCVLDCAVLTLRMACAAAVLSGAASFAEPPDDPLAQFEDYKSIYATAQRGIDQAFADRAGADLAGYSRAVDQVVTSLRLEGQLDPLIAARKEKERLTADSSVPSDNPAALPAAIVRARVRFREAGRQSARQRDIDTLNLVEKYLARLGSLKRELTSRDNIKAALAVKAEMDKALFLKTDLAAKVGQQPAPAPLQAAVGPALTPATLPVTSPLRSGLILWLPFDTDEGDRTSDRSGRRNHGSMLSTGILDISRPAWSRDGRLGGSYSCSGMKQGIHVEARTGTRIRSISLWFSLDDATASADPLRITNATLMLGRRPTPANRDEFRGRLDEVMLYSRALSDREVRQLFAGTAGTH